MNLESLRKKIDIVDDEILTLILKRLDICQMIGNFKKENSIPLENVAREKEILNKIRKNSGEFAPELEKIFECIIKICKNMQKL